MSFPPRIATILDEFRIQPDTKAALYALYIDMGEEVLDVFGDLADEVAAPHLVTPEDTVKIRPRLVERFLRRNHPHWIDGKPTPSFWCPRALEGRAAGLAIPIERRFDSTVREIIGPSQPIAEGMMLLGKNAHFGGRS